MARELSKLIDDFEFNLKCSNSFPFFFDNVLGYDLAAFHHKQIENVLSNRFSYILTPRGHGKTTLWSVGYPIWRMWKERHYQMCLVSSSLDQSTKIMDIVQQSIEENEFLKRLIPEGKDAVQNRKEIRTSNGNYYYVKPFNSSLRGIHPEEMLMDDILRETDKPMSEIKDIFWSCAYAGMTSPAKKGKMTVVGTPMSQEDLFFDLKSRSTWKGIHERAAITDGKGITPEHWIEPLWKEKITLAELKQMYEDMGPLRAAREMMCDPSVEGTNLFKPSDVMACCDENLSFSRFADPTLGPVYLGLDFAMSTSATGDFSAYFVIQQVKEHIKKVKTSEGIEFEIKIPNAIVIRKIDRFKGASFETQMGKIRGLVRDYKPARIIADASSFGTPFVQQMQREFMPISGQQLQYASRNSILINLSKMVETDAKGYHKLVIPASQEDGYAYGLVKRLIQELTSMYEAETRTDVHTFKSSLEHDDMVFGLALACRDINSSAPMAGRLGMTLSDLEEEERLSKKKENSPSGIPVSENFHIFTR